LLCVLERYLVDRAETVNSLGIFGIVRESFGDRRHSTLLASVEDGSGCLINLKLVPVVLCT
jgi:hypothetical protein